MLFDSSVPEPTELLREIVAEAFGQPISDRYVSAFLGGNPLALEAIARRYGVARADVLGTAGATNGIALIYRALVAPGEHILVETPGFDLFQDLAAERGIRVGHFARTGERFAPDLAALERGLQPDTRLIVLSNLHNPSGMALSRDDLEALAAIVEPRGIRVIVDEVYADYAGDGGGTTPAAALSPMFISVSSLTKIFGLSTLRCGWIIAEPATMAAIRATSDRSELSISNLAHAVAALVLERADLFTAHWQHILAGTRPVMRQALEGWTAEGLATGRMPDHGCIAFPRLTGIDDDAAFAEWLIERHGVIVAPGTFFGAPGHVRIGFGGDAASLAEGLAAFTEGLRRYRA